MISILKKQYLFIFIGFIAIFILDTKTSNAGLKANEEKIEALENQ